MVYKDVSCVIGNGVVVHVPTLFEEIDKNAAKGSYRSWSYVVML